MAAALVYPAIVVNALPIPGIVQVHRITIGSTGNDDMPAASIPIPQRIMAGRPADISLARVDIDMAEADPELEMDPK